MSKQKRETIQALNKLRKFRLGPLRGIHLFPDGADDRTIALVAATNLEHSLEDAIASHFKGDVEKLRERLLSGGHQADGAIGTFFAKSWLAHALGVFGPDTMEDLSTIRDVRNTFAHSIIDITFEAPPIARACKLQILDRIPWKGGDHIRPSTPKGEYMYATSLLTGLIYTVTHPTGYLSESATDSLRSILS